PTARNNCRSCCDSERNTWEIFARSPLQINRQSEPPSKLGCEEKNGRCARSARDKNHSSSRKAESNHRRDKKFFCPPTPRRFAAACEFVARNFSRNRIPERMVFRSDENNNL